MLRKPEWTNLLGMRWSRCDLDWVWLAVAASVWIKTKGSTRSVAACQPNQELEASSKQCQVVGEEKCQNGLWSIHSVKGIKVLSSSHYVLLKFEMYFFIGDKNLSGSRSGKGISYKQLFLWTSVERSIAAPSGGWWLANSGNILNICVALYFTFIANKLCKLNQLWGKKVNISRPRSLRIRNPWSQTRSHSCTAMMRLEALSNFT